MPQDQREAHHQAMNRTDIDDTLRDMWATRPRRYKSDRKFAGVAAAIARRYQIDPTLVRVGFVVAAIYGGAGVILYLLGWLLMPVDNDEVSPAEAALGRGHSSKSTALTWVLGIALIPISIGLFSDSPSGLISIAIVGAGLFLLHRHRGSLGQGTQAAAAPGGAPFADQPFVAGPPAATPAATPATSGAAAPDAVTSETATSETATSETAAPGEEPTVAMPRPTDKVPEPEQPTPPAWDPLGVAPFAWDLPEPDQPEPPAPCRPRRRSPVTPVTIGLALVTAGVGTFAAIYDSYLDGPRVVAMVLAVLGTGLVVGSFVRGGRGLIPLAIPLAIITWALAVAPINGWDGVRDQQQQHTPTAVAQVQRVYEVGAGNLEVDLTRVPLTDDTVLPISAQAGAGNVKVTVPENADIKIATCTAGLGNVECLDQTSSGPGNELRVTNNFGEDGPGGGTFELDLSVGIGNVELKRG
jgi:phage shock protein PspC (stress-responsive transcriptional regulator)